MSSNATKRPSNSDITRDVLLATAAKTVILWNDAELAQGTADASAILVLVEASEMKFFGTKINPAVSHKIKTAAKRNEYTDTILQDLFCIEKPDNADRQRLQRIKFAIPAILKAGGMTKIAKSETGRVLLDTSTKYYKCCVDKNVEGTGMLFVSIAKLNSGGRKFLKAELPKTTKTKAGQGSVKPAKIQSMKLAALAKTFEGKIKTVKTSTMTGPETKVLQDILIRLLNVFGPDQNGFDAVKIEKLYNKAS